LAELDLNTLVEDVLKEFNGVSGQKITRQLAPLPNVVADGEQLRSVVTNLLINARDAVGSHGEIKIETSLAEGGVTLAVTDNGCGMSEDFVTRSLFRPFHTTKKKGVGIGMFQSKLIIEAHRGKIAVKSKVGEGTTFRVFLPFGRPAQ
jgi:signal transduction histidine kinase